MTRRSLRKRLKRKHQEELHALVGRLLDNPTVDVSDGLHRLETYTQVLTILQPRISREAVASVIVALICLVLAGLLWSVRVPTTRLTLKVTSEAVRLRLDKPWPWRGDLPLDTGLVKLERLTALEAPEILKPADSPRGDVWLQMRGGSVSLIALSLDAPGILELDAAVPTARILYTRGAPLYGQLTVRGAVHLQAGTSGEDGQVDTRVDLAIPETITFRAEGQGAAPTALRLHPQEPWTIRHVSVDELRFGREIPTEAGDITFVSTITQGTVNLHDVDESVPLRQGDPLTLEGVRGRLVELRSDEMFTLHFEGTVQKLRLGPPDAQRDLAPSWLRYYYHQEPLTFFWSAVVFFWGLLWSIRKTVFH